MKKFEINKSLESTPKIKGFRTPDMFGMMIASIALAAVVVSAVPSIWAIVILLLINVVIAIYLRHLSNDERMDIRVHEQPERIEGYRDDDL